MATVKDTGGADHEGLLEFYEQYFGRHVIYKDDKWQLFKAMGGRTMNLAQRIAALIPAQKRLRAAKIENSAKNFYKGTEGWMLGGVLVFDKRGELTYILSEDVGKPLDVDKLQQAIEDARQRHRKSTTATNVSSEEGESSEMTTSSHNSISDIFGLEGDIDNEEDQEAKHRR